MPFSSCYYYHSAMTTAPTADAIKTSFTFAQFDQIVGEPTYSTLYKLETQATRNAATVSIRLPPPHTNCSGIVEQLAVYVLRAGGPFPRPTYPGDQPVFSSRSTGNRSNYHPKQVRSSIEKLQKHAKRRRAY